MTIPGLIYLLSYTEPEKQQKCLSLIEPLRNKHQTLTWSTQVIQEFSYHLIRKRGLSSDQVKKAINTFTDFELVIHDFNSILKALDIHAQSNLSFWDSLIISSAMTSRCSFILSEDLPHGQRIHGVEIANPFLA